MDFQYCDIPEVLICPATARPYINVPPFWGPLWVFNFQKFLIVDKLHKN